MKLFFFTLIFLLIAIASAQTALATTVSGNVLYQGDSSRPIGYVNVELKNIDNNSTLMCISASNGYYEFNNVPNGNYILTGSTSLTAGGVTYYDPTLVFLYLNGLYQLTPIQMLASDVDGNGIIEWNDYNMIVDFILNGTQFPVGSWKFETKVFSISGLKDGVPSGISGTCSGDVGGTFVPTVRQEPALLLTMAGTLFIAPGEVFSLNIATNLPLTMNGAGIIINFPSDLINIKSVEFKGQDYKFSVEGGEIHVVWGNPNTTPIHFEAGETFVTLHCTTNSSLNQNTFAQINLDGKTSIINATNHEVKNLNFSAPLIKISNTELKFSNFPNPIATNTFFRIYAPEPGQGVIELFNSQGQLVKNIPIETIGVGSNEIEFDATQLSQGSYVCKLNMQTASQTYNKSIRILKVK